MPYITLKQSLLSLLPFALSTLARADSSFYSSKYNTLNISNTLPNITRVAISHPPINLFDQYLASDMFDFLVSIQPSSSPSPPPKVVIFSSADPDFFIAHADLSAFLPPQVSTPAIQAYFAHTLAVVQFLRNTTSTVFITEINGRASGLGNEFILQNDLRYAGPGAKASQLETSTGAFPGAGGVQALPRLANRGRALQYILSGDTITGADGKAIGVFNGYFNDTKTLEQEVVRIAQRIALNPRNGLNDTKFVTSGLYPPQETYDRDTAVFLQAVQSDESQRLLRKALELGNNQTRSRWELGIPETLVELFQ